MRVQTKLPNIGPESLGYVGAHLGFRHGGSPECPDEVVGDSAQVALHLRGLAFDQDDEDAKSLMLLAAKTIDTLDMRIEELEAQKARVRELVRGQNEILDKMPEDERAAFKFVQTFILEMLDAIDEDGAAEEAEEAAQGGGGGGGLAEGETRGGAAGGSGSSARASSSAEPEPRKPNKAERGRAPRCSSSSPKSTASRTPARWPKRTRCGQSSPRPKFSARAP